MMCEQYAKYRRAADILLAKAKVCKFKEGFGEPASDSTAVPINIGDLYKGRRVTDIGYENGGIKVGTINVDVCHIGHFPVWMGKHPNGARVRTKANEAGIVHWFTPKGTRHVCGSVGWPTFNEKAEEDSYWVLLDKDNTSYIRYEYHRYTEAELTEIVPGEDDYNFIFDKGRAKVEFDFIAECMSNP